MSRLLALSIILLCGVASAQTEVADPFAEHLDRAAYRAQNEQYAEALKELRAAYALRQQPQLLLEMARLERRLGHASESLSLYQRWRATGELADEVTQREVADAIQVLGREVTLTAPSPSPYPGLHVRLELRPRTGVVAGGGVLFSMSYLAAAMSGGVFATFAGSDKNLATAGGLLFIPVLGPFASAVTFRNLYWSLPWALVDGTAQVAGLVMMILGVKYKHKVPVFSDRFSLAPFSTVGGGGLMAAGRF